MKQNKPKTILAVLLLASACTLQAATRTSLLNPKADVLLTISSISQVGDAVKKTSFAKLWNDPQFQNALGKHDLAARFKKNMTEEQAHLYLEELKMLKGFLALSLDVRSKELTLVADISDEDYKRSIAMDRRLAEIEGKDGEKIVIHKERWQGVDMYGHLYPNNKSADSWQACIDGTLLMSSSKDWVRKSISTIKKSPITPSKNQKPKIALKINIASILKMVIEEADTNIAKIQAARTADAPPAPQIISVAKILDTLGITTLKHLSVSATFNDDNMTLDSFLKVSKPFKGIFTSYDLTPSSTALQIPYAPADTINYSVARLNLEALWQQIPQMINQGVPPEMAQQINATIMGLGMMLGADPGRDIFANLDTQYVNLLFDSNPEPENLVLFRLKNEAGIKNTLQKIFTEGSMVRLQLGDNFKQVKFRGADLYEIKTSSTNDTTTAIVAEGGYLASGSGKAVRQYLQALNSRNPANQAFYTSALYQQMRREIPRQACGYTATDIGKYVRVFMQMIMNNPAFKMAAANPELNEDNPFPEFDFNKLPSAEYMSKFFGYSFSHMVPDPQGVKSHSVIYYGNNK